MILLALPHSKLGRLLIEQRKEQVENGRAIKLTHEKKREKIHGRPITNASLRGEFLHYVNRLKRVFKG